MAVTTEILWGDGTSDKIYLTRNASEGDQTVSVSSDANTGAARSKVVTFFASGVSPVSLTISQEAGQLTPVFYDKLIFDRASYVDTGIIPALNGAIVTKVGGETYKGQQNVFSTTGYGGSVGAYRLYWGGSTNANRRQPMCLYQTTSYLFNNIYVTNWNEVSIALAAKGFMYNNSIKTYTKGSLACNTSLLLGHLPTSSASAFSGYMREVRIYGDDTANVTSYADFANYTPLYTLKPCTCNGQAGMWIVETGTFKGNASATGTLSVAND